MKDVRPEVSVVMPVFNGSEHISDSIKSVLSQSFDDWELIVCDDGSTDETATIVSEFSRQDARVTLLLGGERSGPGAARNRGLDRARGRWIAFLDSDDLWLPSKIERTLAYAKERQSALTFTAYRKALNPDWRVGDVVAVPESVIYRQLLLTNVINTSTVIIDRDRVPTFRWQEKERPEDYVAWLDVLRGGSVAWGLAEPLTIYRRQKHSESSNKLKLALQVFRIFSRVENLPPHEVIWFFANYAFRGTLKYIKP